MFVKYHDARILKVIVVCIIIESTIGSPVIFRDKSWAHIKEDGTKHL